MGFLQVGSVLQKVPQRRQEEHRTKTCDFKTLKKLWLRHRRRLLFSLICNLLRLCHDLKVLAPILRTLKNTKCKYFNFMLSSSCPSNFWKERSISTLQTEFKRKPRSSSKCISTIRIITWTWSSTSFSSLLVFVLWLFSGCAWRTSMVFDQSKIIGMQFHVIFFLFVVSKITWMQGSKL